MRATVLSSGNSLAVRIPRALARAARLEEGAVVDVSVRDGEIVVRPSRRVYSLRTLLAAVTDENLHGETSTGAPRRRELW